MTNYQSKLGSDCIQIHQQRFTHWRIPQKVSFHLHPDNLSQLQQAKANQQQLLLTPTLLADLRYYALVDRQNCFPPELKFCTYYCDEKQEVAILQSVISLEGQIVQQIRRDYLQHPALLQVASVHYWLIEQLLKQLPLQPHRYSRWLPLILAWLTTVIVALLIMLLTKINLLQLLILIVVCWLLKQLNQKVLLPYLRSWIIGELLFGIFSDQSKRRKIGFELLSILAY